VESMRQATIAARAAMNSLQTDTAICAELIHLDEILADEQRAHRSRLIHDVMLTRKLMQLLKDRAESLSGTLTKLRDRPEILAHRA
jgi:flavin-dependent dehydrogenase